MWVTAVFLVQFLFVLITGGLMLFYLRQEHQDDLAATRQAEATAMSSALTPTPTATSGVTTTLLLLTPTPTPLRLPDSCAAIRRQNPTALDGDYTLYLRGNPALPFTIYCYNMGHQPREYLTLHQVGGAANFALISHPEGALTTHYQKVRLNPVTLVIQADDRTFATQYAAVPGYEVLDAVATVRYAVMVTDYGRAEGCSRGDAAATAGAANIDLTDTPFALAGTVSFVAQGVDVAEVVTAVSPNRQVVMLQVNGRCAHLQSATPLQLVYLIGSGS